MSKQENIAIIGAGYTGLTAAYRLAMAGQKVTILERSTEIGGLAGDFVVQGSHLEKTYHHIFRTDTDIIAFVKELGLEDKLEWRESSVSIYYEGKLHPFMSPLDLLKFSPLNFFNRIRAGAVVFFIQKTKRWKQFEGKSAYKWMKKFSGNQVTKVIWEPLLKGKFDKFYDKVSMAWLWARLHIRANSREKGESKEKLGYFNGGFHVIVAELERRLKEMNVEIKTGVQITDIRLQTSKALSVFIENQGELQFDKVIATTPSHVFAKLTENNPEITEEYKAKLNSINYLGAVCLIFTSDQDLSKFYWHNINDLNSPFLVFINHTKLIEKSRYNGKNVYYIGSYIPHDHKYFSITDDELSKIWFDYLKKMFPDFDDKKIIDRFIFRLKNAQHIVDLDYHNKIPSYETPLKNVYLSNFSQIYPEDRGTNFAIREGNKIAELVLKS